MISVKCKWIWISKLWHMIIDACISWWQEIWTYIAAKEESHLKKEAPMALPPTTVASWRNFPAASLSSFKSESIKLATTVSLLISTYCCNIRPIWFQIWTHNSPTEIQPMNECSQVVDVKWWRKIRVYREFESKWVWNVVLYMIWGPNSLFDQWCGNAKRCELSDRL